MGEGVSFLEEEAGFRISESQLAAGLLGELRRWMEPVPRVLEGELRSEWERRDALHGRVVQVLGERARTGIARGVASEGALLLEAADGAHEEVWSGTIRPLEPGGN
jgi:biotin-(acetyl-CoA carboxylase) ligase